MLPSGILIRCTGPFWSDSLCLFGFCLPSLRCLISFLTQAGGGDLLFRFSSSVQSCCGEGGALQTDILCVGSTHSVLATLGLPRTGVSVLSPSTLLRLPAALYGAGPAVRAVPVFGSSTKAGIRLRLHFVPPLAWAVQAARNLGALSRVRGAFSLRGPRARSSVINLKDAFYSVLLVEESQFLFAFEDPTLPASRLTWTVLPQGFCDSPHLFEQRLSWDLQNFNSSKAVVL